MELQRAVRIRQPDFKEAAGLKLMHVMVALAGNLNTQRQGGDAALLLWALSSLRLQEGAEFRLFGPRRGTDTLPTWFFPFGNDAIVSGSDSSTFLPV